MFYRSKITGAIMRYPYDIDYVYGQGFVTTLIDMGLLEDLPEPSVEDCIKYGSKVVAVIRYREIHRCKLAEAKEAVEKLMEEIQPVNLHKFEMTGNINDEGLIFKTVMMTENKKSYAKVAEVKEGGFAMEPKAIFKPN